MKDAKLSMKKDTKIYVAGHTGLVGSAIVRKLTELGYTNILTKPHQELDLTDREKVEGFFAQEKPEYVFLAAAKVGGIHANSTYPAEFIYQSEFYKPCHYDGDTHGTLDIK